MCEPFSLGAIFASVGSAFKFADLAIRVAEVGSENEVFVRTIRVVRDDLNEVERLLNNESVRRKITSIPGKLPWIRGAVTNTKSALNEIGKWVEHARAEQESTGSIRFETRIRWVFNDHEKLLNRKTELSTCHQQLSNVLSYLLRLEDIPTTSEPPEYIDTMFFDDVLSRHKRKTVQTPNSSHHLKHVPEPVIYAATRSESTLTTRHTSSPVTSKTDVDLTKIDLWPDASPCSPPPTYTSLVSSNTRPYEPSVYNSSSIAKTNPGIEISRDHKSKEPFDDGHDSDTDSRGIWAYKYSDHAALIPELAGDPVAMSGTNSLGPVNPFEFTHSSCTQARSSQKKDKTPEQLVEMLGSLEFAVELPTNDPGPPPGYPRRPKEPNLLHSPGPQSIHRASSHNSWASVSELPTVPKRRPITFHANTDPGQTSSYPTRAVELEAQRCSQSRNQFIVASTYVKPDCVELPPSFQDQNANTTAPKLQVFHGRHLNVSARSTPLELVHDSCIPVSSQIVPALTDRDTHKSADAKRSITQHTQHRTQNPIAIGRMRRQKDMMDLLGSLDS